MGKTNEGWEMSKKETDFFPSFERGVFHGKKVVNAVWLGVGRPGPPTPEYHPFIPTKRGPCGNSQFIRSLEEKRCLLKIVKVLYYLLVP
jgi:hypothetical protein